MLITNIEPSPLFALVCLLLPPPRGMGDPLLERAVESSPFEKGFIYFMYLVN